MTTLSTVIQKGGIEWCRINTIQLKREIVRIFWGFIINGGLVLLLQQSLINWVWKWFLVEGRFFFDHE